MSKYKENEEGSSVTRAQGHPRRQITTDVVVLRRSRPQLVLLIPVGHSVLLMKVTIESTFRTRSQII